MIFGDASEFYALAARATAAGPAVEAAAEVAVERAGRDIETTARALAPVGTGRLRDSITSSRDAGGVEVGPSVDYAPYVEYGTSHMAPQPFMGPAFERQELALGKALGDLTEGLL